MAGDLFQSKSVLANSKSTQAAPNEPKADLQTIHLKSLAFPEPRKEEPHTTTKAIDALKASLACIALNCEKEALS